MKNFTSMLFIMATLFISLPVYSVSVWDGTAEIWTVGSGTESDPYQIQTAQNLAYLAQSVNSGNSYSDKFFIQTDDIDLDNIEWTPIGGQHDRVNYETSHFDASFDGANHLISNVKISGVDGSDYGIGLFGYCKGDGALNNINVTVDINISNVHALGGIVGYSEVPIVNCSAKGTINYSYYANAIGGVVGCSESDMSLCINYCNITGENANYTGGVLGLSRQGTNLNYCTNYGNLRLGNQQDEAGGVVSVLEGGNIYGCVNYGDVSGGEYCGGVAARCHWSISLCKNLGNVSSEWDSGGGYAAGIAYSGDAKECVNYGDVSSTYNSCGIVFFGGSTEKCSNYGAVTAITTSESGSSSRAYGICYGDAKECVNYGDVLSTYESYGISGSGAEKCSNHGAVTAITTSESGSSSRAYGICYGDAKECVNYGDVSASSTQSSGGDVYAYGISDNGAEKCSNHGAVSAISTQSSGEYEVYACGISDDSMSYCYNTGTITASVPSDNPDAVSYAYGCGNDIVSNSYNAGELIGDNKYGLTDDDVTNSFYLESCGGAGAGTPLSSEQMQSSSFIEALNAEGEAVFIPDIDGINNGYSILYLEQTFNVVFKNYDGAVMQSEKLMLNSMPVYKGQTPVRQSDAQGSYSFSGWDPAITPVTSDQIYIAQFSTVNKYTVRFLNEDGTELQNEELDYGTIPVYKGETPTKQPTAQYTYTFNGWDSEIGAVTGAKDYIATYSSTINKYLITFENYDGTELQSKEVSYGDTPVYTGETPSRPSTVQYTYTFIGWDSEIVAVDESKTYTAQFSSTVNKYLITFENYDGTELQSKEVSYGDTPVYTGVTPVKPSTAQYTYNFTGWDSEIVAVDESKTYTAQFSSTVNKYVIRFLNEDGTELQNEELDYGTIPVYSGETPTKDATAQYTYTFNGWDSEIGKVTGAKDYTATYSSIVNKYLITFENYNGDELQSSEVEYGQIPSYTGATPVRPSTAQYKYNFTGWDSEIVAVDESKTYTAQFSSTVNKYLITFENYDGTELQSKEVSYGDTPVYTGATPVKPSTAQYTYAFSGWDSEIVAVDESKTYTAQFCSTVNKYTVRFLNEDGTELQNEELDYGTIPVYKGETPTKQQTAQYTYTFNGWDSEIGKVTGVKNYTATYSSTVNKYLITFENYNGTELQSSEVKYGQIPAYTGATPGKPADAEFTYTFSGWSPEVVAVVGTQTYTAQFSNTTNKYLIRFLNEDGSELQNEELEYGTIPVYTGETPTKDATVQYTYTFNGWDSEICKVTGAKDYTAIYASTVNKYLITFENYNGDELQSSEVEYGQMPSYTGVTPERPADAEFTYTFSGWSPEVVSVVGAQTYTAQFSSTVNKYVIRFLNEDGTELQSEELDYGTVPVYTGEIPTKEATAQYTYTFNGWDNEIGKVTGAKDYIATYSSTINKYLITFENYNGDELQSGEVKYGQIPAYTGATPEKPADAEFTYTFSGWSPEVVAVVGTQTYTAQFNSTVNKYVIRFLNEDGTELQNEELDYGTIPVYKGETPTKQPTAQYTYTFNGWDSEIGAVTGAKDYIATYSSTINKYLITFENYNGDELQSSEVEYGQTPSYTGTTPEKPSDAEFTYTFSGWSPEVVSVVGAQTYTAQFSSTVNKYVIRFLNEDGTELQSEELDYGTIPVYTGEIPTKDATAQYTYTFNGWDSEIREVTGAKDYTATYTSTVNKYRITFENYNGTELQSSELEYGQTPSYTGTTPIKPADAEFTYTFSGWSPELTSVTSAQKYTAQFSSTTNKYLIRFLNNDGTILQSENLEYGSTPSYKGAVPTRPSTSQYVYTFSGWNNTIEPVWRAADYMATYTSAVNKYEIWFVNYDGAELQRKKVSYGDTPIYTGAIPVRPSTAQYTYTFSGWSPEVVSVVGAQTYTAQFSSTVNKYTVTLSGINCDVTGDGVYDYGTVVELLATPHDGYAFQSWSDGNTDNPRTIVVDRDYDISANMCKTSFETISATIFKGDYYEFGDRHLTQRGTYTETFLNKAGCDSVVVLTLSVIPVPTYNVRLSVYKDETWGSVTGDGTYRKGTTATLNAVPASGYKFSYWYDQDTQEKFYENPLSFVVEKAVSLTASFSRAPKIKVTYGQRSAEAEGDDEEGVISYVVSTKQHVDIDNVGSRSILIYSTAGQIMLRQVNVEHYEGHLPSGVYIINIDGVMEKFIVH